MAEWVQWAIGLGLPLVVGWAAYITHHVQALRQTTHGVTGGNGLRAEMAAIKREIYGDGALEALVTRARHGARNAMQTPITEMESRLEELEHRVRDVERIVDRLPTRKAP